VVTKSEPFDQFSTGKTKGVRLIEYEPADCVSVFVIAGLHGGHECSFGLQVPEEIAMSPNFDGASTSIRVALALVTRCKLTINIRGVRTEPAPREARIAHPPPSAAAVF